MKPDQERLSEQERRVVDRCARGVASQQEGEQLLAIFEVLARQLTEAEWDLADAEQMANDFEASQEALLKERRRYREALEPFAKAGKRLICEGDRGYRNSTFDGRRESYRFRVGDVIAAFRALKTPDAQATPPKDPGSAAEEARWTELHEKLAEVERERDEAIEERDHARQKWTEWFKEAHDNVSEERELVRRLYDYACELENRYSHLGYPKAADLLTSESVPKSGSGEEAGE